MIEILNNSLSKFFDLFLKLLHYYLYFALVIFWMNEYELMIYELCNIETNMNIYCCKKKIILFIINKI